ncbi:bacteriophage abortive infection AbiH family protein [Celerinatantimonas yamalensis]|uniref:Bacteriophage abortive infection AbiH family protein n=1 Tax=Celerinatantimonas yamalensis TaxID=559956 RepID=A0ABW9GBX0_9GAMM
MNKLYVIGNGFDLYHGLATSYLSFGVFLQKNNPNLYESMVCYYGLPSIENGHEQTPSSYLWSEFEAALAYIDHESILEEYSDYIASPSSPDFRDRDWGSFQIEIERVVDELTVELFSAFKEFILGVDLSKVNESETLPLDINSLFLNFNYTDTLETVYEIENDNILYIHNQASYSNELILGHAIEPESFEEEEIRPPEGLSDEEYERWSDMMSDNFDHSFEMGKDEMLTYFYKSHKDTQTIISGNESFFSHLNNINEIYVLGHSLSEVDEPYFVKLFNSVNTDTKWYVTYYSEEEKEGHKVVLEKLGIKESLTQLLKMHQLT